MEKKLKIIMVPYPAQGHVTPMLKLASLLLSLGRYQIIIVIPEFLHRRVIDKLFEPPAGGSDRDDRHGGEKDVRVLPISDGMKESGPHDFFSTEAAMENHMPTHFEHLLMELNDDDHQVACVVVDLLASYAIDVSRRCGVPTAGFWPAMLATYSLISTIPNSLRRGIISESGIPHIEGPISFRQDLPPIDARHIPWLIGNSASIESRFKFWKRTLKRAKSLKWLLVNTFPDELHQPQQDVNQDEQKLQKTGSNRSSNTEAYEFGFSSSTPTPMIFPVRLLRKHEQTPSLISLSFWEEDWECLDWINDQNPNSVVYVSFGSWVSPIAETKVRNLALALEASKRPFVWVLKPEWRNGLPAGYIERVAASKQGKVIAWAPQVDVLHHNAVGCFLTHCGWNSTLEAIQAGKCLLCYPVAGDQGLNCEYIVRVWKIGAKINGFSFEEVEDGIKRVMEDGGEMNERLLKFRDKVMGKDASLKVMAGLLSFISDVKNANHSSA